MDQLTLFQNHLPERPYATDNFQQGLYAIPKADAIKSRYIQHNGPTHKRWIVLDVDRPGGGIDWEHETVPAPNIVCTNRTNQHAHLIYGLETPIRVNAPDARIKPMRYAAAIEQALLKAHKADPGYRNFICKNPLHGHWQVNTYEPYLYDLDLLSDYLDLDPYRDCRKHMPAYGLGRNCTLFENLKRWAYRARLKTFDKDIDYWYEMVFRQAEYYNNFDSPLPHMEVKATARSVAKWVWNRFTPAEFSRIQAARSAKAAARRARDTEQREQMILFAMAANPGIKQWELADEFNMSTRTIRRYQKRTSPISDNRL